MADVTRMRRTDRSRAGGRRSGARRAERVPATDRRRRIGWSRRIGVAVGLIAVTGTIALAGSGALDRGSRDPEPSTAVPGGVAASPSTRAPVTPLPLPGAPTILGATTLLTRERQVSVRVQLPEQVPARRDSMVRVYRGDRLVAEAAIARRAVVSVSSVPLQRGSNAITAAIAGPTGEGARSAPVTVMRDDQAPPLRITSPESGLINAVSVTVEGTTEPGLTVAVLNVTTTRAAEAVSDGAGRFSVVIPLGEGLNELSARVEDAAGNAAASGVTVTRGEGRAAVRIDLSSERFRLRRLPASISLRVLVTDADGQAVDGAAVVFSLSPPGLPTATYRTETTRGEASWLDVSLPDGAVPGDGFATAQVTLPDGTVVQGIARFVFD